VIAIKPASKFRQWIKRLISGRRDSSPTAGQFEADDPETSGFKSESVSLAAEEGSKAEFERLQKLINKRKQIAWNTDVSYHLWGLYKNHFRAGSSQLLGRYMQGGKWYDVKILHAATGNGLNKFEFELKGARYRFVDDEEKQGWSDNLKTFSLFLYDDSDHCLIEIPMRIKVDRNGRRYSISSDGPSAFIPGDWINDFINVTLKHQSIRNQEIRAQKHQERLSEIEDLKDRFGLAD
jgi:hypothetical protein